MKWEDPSRKLVANEQKKCSKLLDMLAGVLGANTGRAIESEWYAEGLANKFYDHAFLVRRLSNGATSLNLPSGTVVISGISSLDVLTRAAFEAFLTFHYVFFTPKTQEERDCKFWSYRLAGIMDRKDFPATTDQQKETLAVDKRVIQELSESLQSNSTFLGLEGKVRKDILRGIWRLQPWRGIAQDAGLDALLASHMYSHLCGVAHSSSLSVLQTKLAYEKHEEHVLIEPSVIVLNILIANMIYEYCELFAPSKALLGKDQVGMELVEMWIKIGSG